MATASGSTTTRTTRARKVKDDAEVKDKVAESPVKKTRKPSTKKPAEEDKTPTKQTKATKSKAKAEKPADDAPKAKKARKTPAERDAGKSIFPREETKRQLVEEGRLDKDLFKVISWNVNGLRALTRKQPTLLQELVDAEKPHIVCLQETKIQENHVDQFDKLVKGYKSFWSCSTVKKGYAGTAMFISEKFKPEEFTISYGIGLDKHEGEGRAITVRLPFCNIVALYVPNAGQDLKRLDYRTKEWDLDLRTYLRDLETETGRPCIVCGDLNVAHRDMDVWNPDAKHVPKTAGSTPEERASFTEFLDEMKYVDAFRYLHGDVLGHFTYWSMRTNGRPFNRGNRLDYFCMPQSIADREAKTEVPVRLFDTYVLHEPTVGVSDHCPVACIMEVTDKKE